MALHGLVNYSGAAINLADDEKENILKSAESGAGLYFTYIAEKTSVLQMVSTQDTMLVTTNDWKKIL